MDTQTWLRQRNFEWMQQGRRAEGFTLLARGEVAGSLRFSHRSCRMAEGETPFGRWTLERDGFWKTRYTIRKGDSGNEVAFFKPRWASAQGTLQTTDGKIFRWEPRRFWSGDHLLVDETGKTVLTLILGPKEFHWRDLFKQQARVALAEHSYDGNSLSILILFAWWILLLQQQEAAESAASVAVIG